MPSSHLLHHHHHHHLLLLLLPQYGIPSLKSCTPWTLEQSRSNGRRHSRCLTRSSSSTCSTTTTTTATTTTTTTTTSFRRQTTENRRNSVDSPSCALLVSRLQLLVPAWPTSSPQHTPAESSVPFILSSSVPVPSRRRTQRGVPESVPPSPEL
ncbi:hypothetical protein BKA80DRAFT_255076 [Phyllosticta citrichinensis]